MILEFNYRNIFFKGIALFFIFLILSIYSNEAEAKIVSTIITNNIPTKPATTIGEVFFTKEFSINYIGGDVFLSSNPEGTGRIFTDDGFKFFSIKPTGIGAVTSKTFNNECRNISDLPALNLKNHFLPGENIITFTLYDICGASVGSSAYYLTYEQPDDPTATPSPSTSPVTPFLRLPWDYEAEDLTFNEAATSMSAYFDHEYPLLSTNLVEPQISHTDTMSYEKLKSSTIQYTSHDGYDYAKDSHAYINNPVLAAANGTAKYMGNCTACGNAIVIDHHNGYQTRYYHLSISDLITPIDGTSVEVTKGQQIGLIGFSGNVIPSGNDGAHIHFMVIQDKNNDGNFNDNIPDGITDPYGWQSNDPDPWENYEFTLNDIERKGNKSYYLWDKQLSNLDATLTANGGVFNTERFKVEFPQNFTQQNLNLKLEAHPQVKTSDNLVSIGSTIKATLTDFSGNLKEQFNELYKMTINHKPVDKISIDPTTLSIYSSRDGTNWVKETSSINEITNEVSANLNHMTYFALMAKRIDTTPPTTEAVIEGEKGNDNWYRTELKVALKATDNEGGLGVDYTIYRLDESEWKLYEEPLILKDEKTYKLEYYSFDKDENKENLKSLSISIDKTKPEAKIMVDQNTKDLKISGIDENNPKITLTTVNDLRKYTISDLAGNSIILLVQELNRTKRDNFSIKQISYNSQTPATLASNQFRYGFITKNNSAVLENQFFTMNNLKENIDILYIPATDKSKIIILKNGKLTTKTESGLKLLQVTTNKGTLNYSY